MNYKSSSMIGYNKTDASKECDIYHYYCFLDMGFKYKPYLCNSCHDLMQKAMNFNHIAIVPIIESDYRIHFWYMSKDDAIHLMKNSRL